MILWFGNKKKKQELEEAGKAIEAEEAAEKAKSSTWSRVFGSGDKAAETSETAEQPDIGAQTVIDESVEETDAETATETETATADADEILADADVDVIAQADVMEADDSTTEITESESEIETQVEAKLEEEALETDQTAATSETLDVVVDPVEVETEAADQDDDTDRADESTIDAEITEATDIDDVEDVRATSDVTTDDVVETVSETAASADSPETADDDTQDDLADPLAETRTEGFFNKLTSGMRRSSSKLTDGLTGLFTRQKLDDDTLEELEDLLIMSDMGAAAAAKISANLAKDRFDKTVSDDEVKTALSSEIADLLRPREEIVDFSEGPRPRVVMFVGVNGSGKTTTIGKIASKLQAMGARSMLVAGDTFRAAAIEQLQVWGERSGIPVMSKPTGADAAGLVYEAIEKAQKDDLDLVLVDTAGRLQNKDELMKELTKILRVARKLDPDAPHDVILVLDATVGQNALSQVEAFRHTAGVTGLVMTKLDGTAKGGVLVAIANAHALPIHFVGVGESADDLQPFSADAFARALVGLEQLK